MIKLFITGMLWISTVYSSEYPVNISIADLPPWIVNEDRPCSSGILCEAFEKLNRLEGIKIYYKILPIARANNAAFEGKQDIAFFPQSDVFKKDYIEIGKLMDYQLGYFSFTEKPKGKICTLTNSPHNKPDVEYIKVIKLEQCFKMLLANRVENILLTDIELKPLKESFKTKNSGYFKKLDDLSVWFYINKKLPSNIQKIFKENFRIIQK